MEESPFIVSDIMSKDLVTVKSNQTLEDAANLMLEKGVSSVLVKNRRKILGIVTDKDFVKTVASGKKPGLVKVSKVMSKTIQSVDPKTTLVSAIQLSREKNIRHLLVKSTGEYIGIVSLKDVTETLYTELNEKSKKMSKKIEELEKFYRSSVGRELVMVKLKKRIRELERKLGDETELAEVLFNEQ